MPVVAIVGLVDLVDEGSGKEGMEHLQLSLPSVAVAWSEMEAH